MKNPYICYRTQCRYHSGRTDGNVPSCNYFFITGTTKTSLGEASITRKCGLFKPGANQRLRPQPIVLPKSPPQKKPKTEDRRRRTGGKKYDWGQFRALWEEGKADTEIARAVGCYPETVRRWRRSEGLAPNYRRVIDREKLRELWEAGMDDTQIAWRVGASRQSVQKARAALELPAHNRKGGKT